MTLTVVETGYQAEQATQPKPPPKKSRFRPKALTLPDPRQIGRKLSIAMGSDDKKKDEEKDDSSEEKKDDDSASTKSLWKEDYITDISTPSPQSSASNSKPKPSPGLSPTAKSHTSSEGQPSPAPTRRASLFSHFSFKGSNYDPKDDPEANVPQTPRYRHVPKNAASQFAKTTTVESLAEKTAHNSKQMLPSPSPMKGTMSAQEYNRMYRRTQSLSAGRPYERSNSLFPPVLESTAEVDEEPLTSNPRHSLQPHHMRGFNLSHELTRRMSASNIQSKAEVQRTAEVPPSPRRSSFQGNRRESVASTTSDSISPFKQDFNGSRRGSETGSNPSRRGSLNPQRATAVDVYRVDWSQSDEPKAKRERRWSVKKGRSGSKTGSESGGDEPQQSQLPKAGLKGKFKR